MFHNKQFLIFLSAVLLIATGTTANASNSFLRRQGQRQLRDWECYERGYTSSDQCSQCTSWGGELCTASKTDAQNLLGMASGIGEVYHKSAWNCNWVWRCCTGGVPDADNADTSVNAQGTD